ncbi:MAG TPA: hypothetical protein VFB38_27030 [Chthonomonadaceae bacterium]|nr:hypothetical protein [Chthonomonadaceae bacterium]
MKLTVLLLGAVLGLAQIAVPVSAQKHHHAHKRHQTHPKNEISKLRKARQTNHTVRQVTVDPKKSPGKHLDNLSKNINHEINRESKDVNHFFQGKHKHKK